MDADSHEARDVELDGLEVPQRTPKAKKRSTSLLAKVIAILIVVLAATIMVAAFLLTGGPDKPIGKTQVEPIITAEQARAAILKLNEFPRLRGGEDDPIFKGLKHGAIDQTNDPDVKIGNYFSCNLKEKTWKMNYHIRGKTAKSSFSCSANGTFELQFDGTWKATQTGGHIT